MAEGGKSLKRWLPKIQPASENMVWWLEIPLITYCRVLLAEGSDKSLEKTGDTLQELLRQNRANHNVCHLIQIMPILAMVYKKQGQDDEAGSLLEEALSLAEPGGWVRPFVELGKPMEEMLKQLQVKKSDRNFIEQLLAAFILREQETQVVASPAQPVSELLVEPLTNRELEILNLLAQNLYNKEIGERLYISTETVKTHLKGIYQKLEAGNRREAVAKARTIGLLSNS